MTNQPLVLVADDDDDVLELVTFRLRRWGYRTLSARDGRESLALARAEQPDVAVLDVAMPQMDGLEVTRRLRSDGAIGHMPIILLTARSQEKDVQAGISAGADAYVRKPFSHRELRARVESLLAATGDGAATTTTRRRAE